ncbi:hypothetical protein [Methylobacterium komagatae]
MATQYQHNPTSRQRYSTTPPLTFLRSARSASANHLIQRDCPIFAKYFFEKLVVHDFGMHAHMSKPSFEVDQITFELLNVEQRRNRSINGLYYKAGAPRDLNKKIYPALKREIRLESDAGLHCCRHHSSA